MTDPANQHTPADTAGNAETDLSRRAFVAGAAAAGSGLALSSNAQAANPDSADRRKICVFSKPFQSLSYDELADRIAELGFDGIEAPIRNGGHIEPEQVPDELPKMVEALKKRGLEITVMASSVNRVDQKHTEETLRTAASLGIPRYRLQYFRYDFNKPILQQIEGWRSAMHELAALNAELGIQGVFQNHSGGRYFSAPIWDLHRAIHDLDPAHLGMAFDIRHATVEGGECWPIQFHLMRQHFGIVYVKDAIWKNHRDHNVPLGEGMIDKRFFRMLDKSEYAGPISLHEEYLDHRDPDLVPKHLEAIERDFKLLKKWLRQG